MGRPRFLLSGVLARAAVAAFGAVVVMASCTGADEAATTTDRDDGRPTTSVDSDDQPRLDGVTFEVRSDPGCGCCISWVEYLRQHGASVEVSEDADRAQFRTGLGLGADAASCHTAVVDGYAIEGHVPIGAIVRLLDDRPEVAGLALPGMPPDSPGMGGDPSAWSRLPVMAVGEDGELDPFAY